MQYCVNVSCTARVDLCLFIEFEVDTSNAQYKCRLGWNEPYKFEVIDLLMSSEQLVSLLDNHENNQNAAPFSAIKFCVGEYIYGGHIVDDIDRRLLNLMLNRFCCSDVLRPGHALSPSGEFRMPLQDGNQASWLRTVESLPVGAPLEFLGLHESANVEKNKHETLELLTSVFLTECRGQNRQHKSGSFQKILNRVDEFLSLLPSVLHQVRRSSSSDDIKFIKAVLMQELAKYKVLISVIKDSLIDVSRVFTGHRSMSPFLETTGLDIGCDQIPIGWCSYSYLSKKKLTPYVHDMLLRYNFFSSWLQQAPPSLYWMSAFFVPLAFILAVRLEYTSRNSLNIMDTDVSFKLLSIHEDSKNLEPPAHGVYVRGIFIQSARWDVRRQGLVECLPKTQFTPAPLIWFEPTSLCIEFKSFSSFACPLYRTTSRRGTFSSDGQSTNFIMCIDVPSPSPARHWIERGTAMLLQPD